MCVGECMYVWRMRGCESQCVLRVMGSVGACVQ